MSEINLTPKQQIAFELTKKLIEHNDPDPATKAIEYADKILSSDKPSIGFIKAPK
jgi:hypothetical protein